MDWLTIFGLFTVITMLICYALEPKSHWFILAFAVSCGLGSVYGFLQGAWPFGFVEIVWVIVVMRRWFSVRNSNTEKEIRVLEEKLKQADMKNDPDAMNELIADDAVLTGQDGKIFTKQTVIDAHQPAGISKFTRFDVSDLDIQDCGETAIVTCRIDLATQGFTGALRFTRVWRKLHDRWQITAGHISEVKRGQAAF